MIKKKQHTHKKKNNYLFWAVINSIFVIIINWKLRYAIENKCTETRWTQLFIQCSQASENRAAIRCLSVDRTCEPTSSSSWPCCLQELCRAAWHYSSWRCRASYHKDHETLITGLVLRSEPGRLAASSPPAELADLPAAGTPTPLQGQSDHCRAVPMPHRWPHMRSLHDECRIFILQSAAGGGAGWNSVHAGQRNQCQPFLRFAQCCTCFAYSSGKAAMSSFDFKVES